MKNGLKVMLPADRTPNHLANSLVRLDKLNRNVGLFGKAVKAVDLRFNDRIVISPMKDASKTVGKTIVGQLTVR